MIRGLLSKPPWFDEITAGLSWPTAVVWEALTNRLGRELPLALNNSLLTSEAAICEKCGKQVIKGIAKAGNPDIVIEVLSMLMEQKGSLLVSPAVLLAAALDECDYETQGSIVWILSKKQPEVANWIEEKDCYFPNLKGYLLQRGQHRSVRFELSQQKQRDTPTVATTLEKLRSRSFESLFRDLLILYLGDEDTLVDFLTKTTEEESLLLIKYFKHMENHSDTEVSKTEVGSIRIPSSGWGSDYVPRRVGVLSSSEGYVVVAKGEMVRNAVNLSELLDIPLNIGSRVVVTTEPATIRNTLDLYEKFKKTTFPDSALHRIGIANSFLPVEKNKNTHGSWVEVSFGSKIVPLIQSDIEPLPPRVQDFIEFFLAVRFGWEEERCYKWQRLLYNKSIDVSQARELLNYLPTSTVTKKLRQALTEYPWETGIEC
eukprot:TRINITY_DN31107_c0_g1_i1.p1 TRINITY_DN31107_c0_g1~~TRINITY_DN31107_c0_g1_i1.p1  ORF type:complete len:429 (+),score=71.69 TRINITY_DN31107_c0_g1_i1:41-1327(+)